jgi:hypothetical protein
LAIVAVVASGLASRASASSLVRAAASDLAPGAYLWAPPVAVDGPMNMVVDLTSQRAFVYQGGTLVGITTIASGKPGYETPDGTFIVLEKEKSHHSNKYDDAPMPYMQRLTWSGLALHGGHPRGYPASHGCIRLPMGFAAALFKEDTRGMQVVITGHAPSKDRIMMASRARARVNPPCCEANASNEGGNLPATGYGSGQGDSNPPPEEPCCEPAAQPMQAVPPASPQCGRDRETGDESNNSAGAGDVYRESDQLQRNGCSRGYDQGQDDLDPSQEAPPPDLPPPPR